MSTVHKGYLKVEHVNILKQSLNSSGFIYKILSSISNKFSFTDSLILLFLCSTFFLHLHGAALVSLGSTKLRSVFVTTHIISLFRLTLPSLTAVHSEICWLVSLEPRLLYSGPIDLDSVWMRPLSNQHLMNSQCTWSRCNWLKYNHCSPLILSISGEVSSY